MNIKLKGSRLEAEIDKCRGECNWDRLSDLLPAIRVKSNGLENLTNLFEGELILEKFLEQKKEEDCFPKESYYDYLRKAETLLFNAVAANSDNNTVIMESYSLLSKLHFFSSKFSESLLDIERSKIDAAKTQFITLRSLKLAAESYAIKGFLFEILKQPKKRHDRTRIIRCFETSVNLAISYISELQKTINSKPRVVTSISINGSLGNLKIGRLLEMALERAPYLSLRKSIEEKRWDLDGIEWYRRIMTELSDKTMVEHVQQKLCRQLAEVLIRGMLESSYEFASRAINLKSKSLSFYTGSNANYFAPKSRFEEVILLLMISEVIASQLAKINRVQKQNHDNIHGIVSYEYNLKMVHNLLVFVLSNLRQYNLLSLIYERSMDFANEDRHMWFQFALTLICDNRFVRAIRTLSYCATLDINENKTTINNNETSNSCANGQTNSNSVESAQNFNSEKVIEQMLVTRIYLEHLNNPTEAMNSASKAVKLSTGTWLAGRCMMLYAFALSEKSEYEIIFEKRKAIIAESIKSFERAIELDPHDDLAHFFCALEYALIRNLTAAQERCQRTLEINVENPSALMLMALIYTAKKDYKSALELVINAISDFPTHYGLLVLKLKLESKYGRVQEALHTSKDLLNFWRKVSKSSDFMTDASMNYDDNSHYGNTILSNGNGSSTPINGTDTISASNTLKTLKQFSYTVNTPNNIQKTNKETFVPVTSIFTAPLGIATFSNANSHDLTDTASVMGQNATATNISEYGGTISTVTDSLGLISSSSKSYMRFPLFQIQANIWVDLAEFLLEVGRTTDVKACVEEVCSIYPISYSHQALYLKGRLLFARSFEVKENNDETMQRRWRSEGKNCFLGALSIFPAHTPSLIYLSKIYTADGNLKMAEKVLRDVIDIDPLNNKYWHSLGKTLAKQNRIEEANECFRTAGSLSFNTPIIPFSAIPKLLKPCLYT